MAKWTFEPGHTAAEFCARHMMVTYVRGCFKNVRGSLVFDPANPRDSSVEATIDAGGLWSGEPDRDESAQIFWTWTTIPKSRSKAVRSRSPATTITKLPEI
jgi:polyisoprenoid-binding protein YceI